MQLDNPDEDKFYEQNGLKPPARFPHITEEELEHRFEQNRTNRHCEYRQRGPEVYCITCQHKHGTMVGINMRLTGTDSRGLPILVRL